MSIDTLARAAGFKTASDFTTSNANEKIEEAFGLDVITSPLMPEGWFALRNGKGALCVGPKGSFWVPAFDLEEFANRPIEMKL